jgi:hypothetical protein
VGDKTVWRLGNDAKRNRRLDHGDVQAVPRKEDKTNCGNLWRVWCEISGCVNRDRAIRYFYKEGIK